MKKNIYSLCLAGLSSFALAGDFGSSSQDIDSSSSSSSLLHNLNVAGFYDDNVHAGTAIRDKGSFVLQSALNSSFSSIAADSTFAVGTRLGGLYNENVDDGFDHFEWDLAANASYYKILDARNVLSSVTSISYLLDDNAAYGNTSSRGGEEYFAYNISNSITTQLNQTLQSTFGVVVSGTNFDGSTINDRANVELNGRLSERLTQLLRGYVAYSYKRIYADDSDSDIQKLAVGGDYEMSSTESLNAEIGVQFRKIESGDHNRNVYASLGVDHSVNNALTLALNSSYGADEQGNILNGVRYDDKKNWNANLGLIYLLSKRVTLTSDISYLLGQYEGAQTAATEGNENKITLSKGLQYAYSPQVTLNASYSFIDSRSDISADNDYNRNRFSLGANIAF